MRETFFLMTDRQTEKSMREKGESISCFFQFTAINSNNFSSATVN